MLEELVHLASSHHTHKRMGFIPNIPSTGVFHGMGGGLSSLVAQQLKICKVLKCSGPHTSFALHREPPFPPPFSHREVRGQVSSSTSCWYLVMVLTNTGEVGVKVGLWCLLHVPVVEVKVCGCGEGSNAVS